jgi:hypothetical protein
VDAAYVEAYVALMSDIIRNREESLYRPRLSALGGLANITGNDAIPRPAFASIVGLIELATHTLQTMGTIGEGGDERVGVLGLMMHIVDPALHADTIARVGLKEALIAVSLSGDATPRERELAMHLLKAI